VDENPPSPIRDPFAPGSPAGPVGTSGAAIGSFVSALMGFVCLWGVGGLLAIALGLVARGDIERSEGRRGGRGLANAGIALGALNLVASVVALGALITWAARPSKIVPPSRPTVAVSPLPSVAPRSPTPAPSPSAAPTGHGTSASLPAPGEASRQNGVIETRVGRITLVDVGPDIPSLQSELDHQRTLARTNKQKLLVWLVVKDCHPCNGVAAALGDRRMQRALADVRLVRIDVNDFALELARLHIPVQKLPGFALLGTDDRPVDFVHGGEWDADIPANIAPVLGSFVRGTYTKRRHPWHGGRRDDETPI
jgi:hypothetical protein